MNVLEKFISVSSNFVDYLLHFTWSRTTVFVDFYRWLWPVAFYSWVYLHHWPLCGVNELFLLSKIETLW